MPNNERITIPPHLRPLVRRLRAVDCQALAGLRVSTDVARAWHLAWDADRVPILDEQIERLRVQAVADLAAAVREVARVSHYLDDLGHFPDCAGCLLDQVLASAAVAGPALPAVDHQLVPAAPTTPARTATEPGI